jgi:hypothetical protein
MRNGFIVFSANKDVDFATSATALAAETLMKWRRVVLIATTIAVVVGQRNSVSNVGIGTVCERGSAGCPIPMPGVE